MNARRRPSLVADRRPHDAASRRVAGSGRCLWVTITLVVACGVVEPSRGSGDPVGAAAGEADAVDAPSLIGYDLRRLRPRDQPLAAMFDEKAGEARGEGKRVVALFSADWCEPCRRLDLELGNRHPPELIGDVRIFELKEEEWQAATRIDEFNRLRARWYPALGSYPVMVVLDERGQVVEEMKEGRARLEREGLEPTLPLWFESTRDHAATTPVGGVPG